MFAVCKLRAGVNDALFDLTDGSSIRDLEHEGAARERLDTDLEGLAIWKVVRPFGQMAVWTWFALSVPLSRNQPR